MTEAPLSSREREWPHVRWRAANPLSAWRIFPLADALLAVVPERGVAA